MNPQILIQELKSTEEFFERSTGVLVEEDSGFSPTDGLMTTAQQVAHVAKTLDWFREGAFENPDGFDMDFSKEQEELAKVTSLKEAREQVKQAFATLTAVIEARSAEELAAPLPEGPVMGGAPRSAIVGAIVDHTAHHRGVLTVYSRLCGRVPAMPYM